MIHYHLVRNGEVLEHRAYPEPPPSLIEGDAELVEVPAPEVPPPPPTAEERLSIVEAEITPVDPARKQEFLSEQALADMVTNLNTMTPAEIEAWVEANAGNLNTPAKNAIKLILKILAIDKRR